MASLTIASGVGAKGPAAFVVEHGGCRLLLDVGEGPTPGQRPDPRAIGEVSALCLTHAHPDHVGALGLHEVLGRPPVYATAATWCGIDDRLVPRDLRRLPPERGWATVAGIEVQVGRNGHAPGGIWIHLAVGGGITYMGDWSVESELLPFDPPPRAELLVTDASYGDRDQNLEEQVAAVAEAARGGAVLPVPSLGRGPEMALRLYRHELRPTLDAVIAGETGRLLDGADNSLSEADRSALADILRRSPARAWSPREVIVATGPAADCGLTKELAEQEPLTYRFLFTGHVAPGTQGRRMLEGGRARWLPWNAHPRLSDNLALADATGARMVIAAFCSPEEAPVLARSLGGRLSWDRRVEV